MLDDSVLDNIGKKNFAEHIILAEFDIDRGASIRCQYPVPTGGEEQFLAEMMLPDGVHNRKDDWTVFFLNRDEKDAAENLKRSKQQWEKKEFLKRNPEIAAAEAKKQQMIQERERKKVALRSQEPFDGYLYELTNESEWVLKGKFFVFLYEFMNRIEFKESKQIENDSRFVINTHPHLDYVSMEPLYSAVITDSGATFGLRLSNPEHQTLWTTQIEGMIATLSNAGAPDDEQVDLCIDTEIPNSSSGSLPPCPISDELPPFLYCLNKVVNKPDERVRRGAVVKAIAICSRYSFVHIYRPLLILALDQVHSLQTTDYEPVLKQLYDAINSAQAQLPPGSKKSTLSSTYNSFMFRRMEQHKSSKATMNLSQTPTEVDLVLSYTPGDLSHTAAGSKMKLKAPIYPLEDNIGGGEQNQISQLIARFGPAAFITIFNAVITGRRIVFVGKQCTSEDLCNCVLASIASVCPPLRGVCRRSFPYTNLANLGSFLGVPGYIIGTANPIFEERKEWWDVLCNLDTNKIFDNEIEKTKSAGGRVEVAPWYKMDAEVIEKLQSAMSVGSTAEDNVKVTVRNYVQMIVDIAMNVEEFKGEPERKQATEQNSKRAEAWRKSNTFETYETDLQKWAKESKIQGTDVPLFIRRLRVKKDINDAEMIKMFETFTKDINTEEQLLEFLSYMPESKGGLYPIAVSLYHSSIAVRKRAVELFKRLDALSGSSSLLQGLNLFLYSGFLRQCTQ